MTNGEKWLAVALAAGAGWWWYERNKHTVTATPIIAGTGAPNATPATPTH